MTAMIEDDELAHLVFAIMRGLPTLEGKVVRQLWADRQFLLLRVRTMAEGLESGNSREEVITWGREGFQEVWGSIDKVTADESQA